MGEIRESNGLEAIEGLQWTERWQMMNDPTRETESYVVPFPQMEPFNLVFHGESRFDYGHYGIHLGQEDQLTFLGHPDQAIVARFFDAREASPTAGAFLETSFKPSSRSTLKIPPGVAHSFSGLEKITTINSYRLFLPTPGSGPNLIHRWNPASDVINFTHREILSEKPLLKFCTEPASTDYYRKIAARLSQSAKKGFNRKFPETFRVQTSEGEKWISLYERSNSSPTEDSAILPEIPIRGARWRIKPFVSTGNESGIVPFADEKPFFVVDHGFTQYSNDTYGIHLGQEDHLSFVGPANQMFRIDLVDARHDSPTRGVKFSASFLPCPWRELVIPAGVAHRFKNLENIFTINQPQYRIHSATYRPGLDTLDWDEGKDQLPSLIPYALNVDEEFYQKIIQHQARLRHRSRNSTTYSPTGYFAKDRQGNQVKLVFRKRGTP